MMEKIQEQTEVVEVIVYFNQIFWKNYFKFLKYMFTETNDYITTYM